MQQAHMDPHAFERMMEAERQGQAMAKVHHEHMANGQVRVRQFYTGSRDRDIHEAMDRDRATLEAAGASSFHRTKIGRNATCPCGSGRKFKKCCINGAQIVRPA